MSSVKTRAIITGSTGMVGEGVFHVVLSPGRALFPNSFCTLRELGLAMISAVSLPNDRKIIEGRDIVALAKTAAM